MPPLPSSKDLFVNALKVHQAVYEGTRGLSVIGSCWGCRH